MSAAFDDERELPPLAALVDESCGGKDCRLGTDRSKSWLSV